MIQDVQKAADNERELLRTVLEGIDKRPGGRPGAGDNELEKWRAALALRRGHVLRRGVPAMSGSPKREETTGSSASPAVSESTVETGAAPDGGVGQRDGHQP